MVHPMGNPPSRPWCCPEPTCTPVAQMSESADLSQPVMGLAWWCLGKMERPRSFTYDGIEHTNNLNDCHYSPLKGVIRWEENADDIGTLASTYAIAAKKLAAARPADE
jgi:hypothetical protein